MKTIFASVLGVVLASGCVLGDPPERNMDPRVIGGSDDAGDPAVGMLRIQLLDGSVGVCTATLIAPNVMVTAAHCADRALFDVSFDARPDPTARLGSNGYIFATVVASPAYTGDPLDGHDVAVVLLSRQAPGAPVPIGPAPAKGNTVRAVGYGMNVFGEDGTGVGTKRTLEVRVNAATEHEIVTGRDGASTCHGDSGGPLFDAAGNIVATTSYGDTADCHGSAHDMRLDDNLDFLGKYVRSNGGGDDGDGDDDDGDDDDGDDDGGSTNHCRVSQNGRQIDCIDGACTCSIGDRQVGTCSAADPTTACSTSSNCCGF